MNYLKSLVITAFASLLGTSVATAEDDIKDVVICAVTEMHACALHEGCKELNPKDVNAIDFMRVDLKTMELSGRRYDGTIGKIEIEKKTSLPKLLLLQGTKAEPDELVDGLAYSIAIHVDTGRLAASVASTETVYSMLGNCHAL
jgi:hypothetical protein